MGKYRVPEGETVRLVINDPRGTEIYKSDLKLNSFGSA